MQRLADQRHVGLAGERQPRAEIDLIDNPRVVDARFPARPDGERGERPFFDRRRPMARLKRRAPPLFGPGPFGRAHWVVPSADAHRRRAGGGQRHGRGAVCRP